MPLLYHRRSRPTNNEVTSAGPLDCTRQRLRAVFGGSIGNLIEWYDWYTYSACSIYFAPLFFPE